jgi:3-phosphoshikimate 1-carboxyvinyltransferase
VKIKPAKRIKGAFRLPGDKSISHRAAIFSAMAAGATRIENFSTAADCASTLSCLKNLGVEISAESDSIRIRGVGKDGFQKPSAKLDCGNSGTTMRLLTGVLAGQNFETILTGDASLTKRPMRRVIEPLEKMGAKTESENGCAPLRISGKNPLKSIDYELPVASAQVKSCILLAALNSDGKTSVTEKTPTRDHTERMLRWFGVEVEEIQTNDGKRISVSGDAELKAKNLLIPSDISSAAFFLTAAACAPDSEIILENVGLNSTRAAVVEVLRNFGADVEILNQKEICNEPVGDLRVAGKRNLTRRVPANLLSGKIIANLIDEIPVLAIFGTQVAGGLEVRDAAELRVKESDRIAAIVENLRKMNASIEEFPDGFRVEKSNLKGARVESFGDHRIAMAFAVAGLFADGETEITGAEDAKISFPDFFQILEKSARE